MKTYTVEISRYGDILPCLSAMFPKLKAYFSTIMNGSSQENVLVLGGNKEVINFHESRVRKIKDEDIYLVPFVYGSGGKRGGLLQIAIGVALIAAVGIPTFPGAGAFNSLAFEGFAGIAADSLLATVIRGVAFNLILGGLQSLLLKPPKNPERDRFETPERRNNDVFEGLANTVSSDTPIALHYGMPRIAGQLLSGYIKTNNHGRDEVITVGNFF